MRAQSEVWIGIADDDLEAAEHCIKGEQYLWSMFMCQQAVEKAVKAVYFEKFGNTPPKKHDLIALAGDASILDECSSSTKDLFRRLSLYYIETRYPDKRRELESSCNSVNTKEFIKKSKEVVEWLKNKLN